MIILGSSSPRRIELLKTLITDFKIIKPSFDEKSLKKSNFHYALKESYFKAISIKNLAKPEDFLISCDTIVKYKNKILGKPSSISEATNYLKMLSNKTHKVISGVTIIYQNKIYKKEITTKVYFNNSPNGWATAVILLCVFGGLQIFCLGIIGEYVGQVFREVKGRPRYIKEDELD